MNLSVLFQLVYLSIPCGALSALITQGAIFNPLHAALRLRSPWLDELLSCPWCTSQWIAAILVCIYHPIVISCWVPIDYFVSILVMAALASVTVKLVYSIYKSMD